MKYLRNVALIITMGVVIGLLPFFSLRVSAAVDPCLTLKNAQDFAGISNLVDDVNTSLSEKNIPNLLAYNQDDFNKTLTFIFYKSAYTELNKDKQRDAMQVMLTAINHSASMSSTAKNKIYNFIENEDEVTSAYVRQLSQDIEPDYVRAMRWYEKLHLPSILSLVLAVADIFLLASLSLVVIIDLAYITLPPIQMTINEVAGDRGSKKPWCVSVEAYEAVLESDNKAGSGTYVNPINAYLSRSIKKFVIIGVCILYITGGKLFILFSDIIDTFRSWI